LIFVKAAGLNEFFLGHIQDKYFIPLWVRLEFGPRDRKHSPWRYSGAERPAQFIGSNLLLMVSKMKSFSSLKGQPG